MAVGVGVMSLPMELVGNEEVCMQDMDLEEDEKQGEKQEKEKDDTQKLKEYIPAPGSSMDRFGDRDQLNFGCFGAYRSPVIEVAIKPPIQA